MTSAPQASKLPVDYFHDVSSDSVATLRMRFHQSWYRHHYLREPSGLYKGKMLGSRLNQAAASRGANFLHSDAFAAAKQRYPGLSSGKNTARLWLNLLTSEALCFNLFGPLLTRKELAAKALKACGLPVARVTEIRFEYAPEQKEKYLADNTSFDAFIIFEDFDGRKGFLGVETKLTEPFSANSYSFEARYARWLGKENWCWVRDAEASFPDKKTNQLWRNQLLYVALLENHPNQYKTGWSVAIAPEIDKQAADSVKAYAEYLSPEAPFKFLTLERLWSALFQEAQNLEETNWLRLFHLRYLDLEASDPAWRLV